MKWMVWITLALLAVFSAYFTILSWKSRTPPVLGLDDGRLLPCRSSLNCVSSEGPDSRIPPLLVSGPPEQSWDRAVRSVQQSGGRVIERQDGYLRAEFQSPLFRFVDDLELRQAADQGVIHIRSASRVGNSDLGANERRVDRLRRLLEAGER